MVAAGATPSGKGQFRTCSDQSDLHSQRVSWHRTAPDKHKETGHSDKACTTCPEGCLAQPLRRGNCPTPGPLFCSIRISHRFGHLYHCCALRSALVARARRLQTRQERDTPRALCPPRCVEAPHRTPDSVHVSARIERMIGIDISRCTEHCTAGNANAWHSIPAPFPAERCAYLCRSAPRQARRARTMTCATD